MGNCLKTQLKEAVANNSLEKIDEIIFPTMKREGISTAGSFVFALGATLDGPITVTVDAPGVLAENFADLATSTMTTITVLAGQTKVFYLKNDVYNVHILGKKNLKSLKVNAGPVVPDLSKLKYTPLTFFSEQNETTTGSLKNFEGHNLTNFESSSRKITGNINSIMSDALTTLIITSPCQVEGFLVNITSNTIKNINIAGLSSTNEIKDFVAVQKANNRSTATIHLVWSSNIKLNGQLYNTSNTTTNLFYDNSKIIMYQAGDYSVTYDTATTLWVYGATAQEIASWQAAGKTVYDYSTVPYTTYNPTNA